jgi:hypothetical protein
MLKNRIFNHTFVNIFSAFLAYSLINQKTLFKCIQIRALILLYITYLLRLFYSLIFVLTITDWSINQSYSDKGHDRSRLYKILSIVPTLIRMYTGI